MAGSPAWQGRRRHHVISQQLVLEFMSKTVLNANLVAMHAKIKSAFEQLIPGIEVLGVANGRHYPSLPRSQDYPTCNDEFLEALNEAGPEHGEFYKVGIRQQRSELVANYASGMLRYYNSLPGVTHPLAEGNGFNQESENSVSMKKLRMPSLLVA